MIPACTLPFNVFYMDQFIRCQQGFKENDLKENSSKTKQHRVTGLAHNIF